MSDWPVGLSTGCFFQNSIFDCLETISRGGFNIIEICSFAAHLNYHDVDTVARAARRLEELGMEAYSFHAPFADHIDISSSDSSLREQALVEVIRAAEAAATFQVRYFVIHPGPEHWDLKEQQERLDRLKWAAETLNQVAERCQELGIGCVLENKLPHLLFAHTSDLLWILTTMDTVDVGVCLDTGHASLSGDIYSVMHKLGRHLRMVHAHDNHGRGDEHLAPGTGNIDWNRLLAELDRTGFRGGFILELASIDDVQHLLANARKSKRFLRNIGRRLALSHPPTARADPQ
ncbi:MAG TPA: sugar phosphate isomerase/epimerase family protein [Chthoniobacterales bacterium]|nr:sugar phosphate isomerase/epimerase family protein [Chthoniobacterales bacterium]